MKADGPRPSDEIYFSVVVPLYNKAAHVEHTLRTVLSQTHRAFEVVVVDDGSTDDGAVVVRGMDDPRIRLVTQSNAGVSVARNRGAEVAAHDLIAFLDADDEWTPTYLATMAGLVADFPEASVFGANYTVVEPDGTELVLTYPGVRVSPPRQWLENYFASALNYTPLWTSAVVVRRGAFLDSHGFPPGVHNGEDLDLWCRLALTHRIAYVNDTLAVYRRDSTNSLSQAGEPVWYPFLDYYKPSPNDLVADSTSVLRYVTYRQLEAASSTLQVLRDPARSRAQLAKVRAPRLRFGKYLGLLMLSRLPRQLLVLLPVTRRAAARLRRAVSSGRVR